MRFRHQVVHLGAGEAVEVKVDRVPANVILLDEAGFYNYQTGAAFDYMGGSQNTNDPVVLKPPTPGVWHLVVDRRVGDGSIAATYRILQVPNLPASPIRTAWR